MVQVKVRSKGRRRTKNTSRKTAPFTQLAPQVSRNRDSFNRKPVLSVHTSVPQGNHVHEGGTNKRATHLKGRSKEQNDDSAAIL